MSFKTGDKVFAKMKGYPPWPAIIEEANGKRFNIKFYGTNEQGFVKSEDIYFYLKHKEQLYRPTLKRQDYIKGIKEIEEAIEKAGGSDGNVEVENEENETIAEIARKERTRVGKRSQGESVESPRSKKVKKAVEEKPPEPEEVKVKEVAEEEPTKPKSKVKKVVEEKGIPISELADKIIPEKELLINIEYAKAVQENETFYKKRPVEPRLDREYLVIHLEDNKAVGIKLYDSLPLKKFEDEFERAMFDKSIAEAALKKKADSYSDINIESTADELSEILFAYDLISKKQNLDHLKQQALLISIDCKIKNCLQLESTETEEALKYLDQLLEFEFTEFIMKKHAHVVEMVWRLRKYVGNNENWKLNAKSLKSFEMNALKIRCIATQIYDKFKKVVQFKEEQNFWDKFTDLVGDFRKQCKDFTANEIYVLTDEPYSRKTFFDRFKEKED